MRRLRARLRGFRRAERGATAVEFAMTAGPMIFLMLAIFEYAFVYLVSVTLDSATREASRQIRTGEAQTAGMTAGQFKTIVCDSMGWLKADCTANLDVDSRVFTSFTATADPSPTTAGAFDKTKLKWGTGAAGEIVLVSTYYRWQLLTSSLLGGLSSPMYGSGYAAVTARTTFRNEPFGT